MHLKLHMSTLRKKLLCKFNKCVYCVVRMRTYMGLVLIFHELRTSKHSFRYINLLVKFFIAKITHIQEHIYFKENFYAYW